MTILVQHLGSLGDTIVSIPALRAIRAEWPAARIVLMHNTWRTPRPGLVSPMDVLDRTGLVDASLPYVGDARRFGKLLVIGQTLRAIRRTHAEIAVFIGPTARSPEALRRDRAFFRAAGITRLIGYHACDAPRPDETGPTQVGTFPLEAQRKLDRLARDGVRAAASPANLRQPLLTPSAADASRVDAWLDARGVTPGMPLVAIGMTTLMPSKVWPHDRFVEIGRRLMQAGVLPIVTGAQADEAAGEALVAAWGGGLNGCGGWSLHESAVLLARCGRYLGLDSGGAHLAAAVGCRCTVITSGFTRPGQWDPLGPGHVILRHHTPCEGCGLEVCPLPDHPCMRGITVDAVWSGLSA